MYIRTDSYRCGSILPGAIVLFGLAMVLSGDFPWWLFFFVIPFVASRRLFCATPYRTMPRRKQIFIGDVEKRKNDDLDEAPQYIRAKDGTWLEIVD